MRDFKYKLAKYPSIEGAFILLDPSDTGYTQHEVDFSGTHDECCNFISEYSGDSGSKPIDWSSQNISHVNTEGTSQTSNRGNGSDIFYISEVLDKRVFIKNSEEYFLGFREEELWLTKEAGEYTQLVIKQGYKPNTYSIHNIDDVSLGFKDEKVWVSDRVGGYEEFSFRNMGTGYCIHNKSYQVLVSDGDKLSVERQINGRDNQKFSVHLL